MLYAALMVLALQFSGPQPTLPKSTLVVESGGKSHRFVVELASTPEQRNRGLMFRTKVPPGTGMLFDYHQEVAGVAFWMKNTPKSLDIIYARSDGTIVSIAERTTPYSEKPIPAGAPTKGVLEVKAGTVKKLGIKAGDRMRHAIFSNAVP